jgi:molecular chaperone GrpE
VTSDSFGMNAGAHPGAGDVRGQGAHDGAAGAGGEPAFQFRDRRRIDPNSGAVRSGAALPDPGSVAANPANPANAAQPITGTVTAASQELAAAKQEAAERTADLQRITAEYANYRKRTDRDRAHATLAGKALVIGELLSVLDDLDSADRHGDLVGPFKAVADRLVASLSKQGLAAFGADGDLFDPTVHEAVQFGTSTEVDHPTVTSVFRRGYTLSDRVLRPAVVVVTGPEHGEPGGTAPGGEVADLDDADQAAADSPPAEDAPGVPSDDSAAAQAAAGDTDDTAE